MKATGLTRKGNSPEQRIELLRGGYRAQLNRYLQLETLADEEHDLLRSRNGIQRVSEILQAKRELLDEIRSVDEGLATDRAWWVSARRDLPAASGGELMQILEAVSVTVERILALEAACRDLLACSLDWKRTQTTEDIVS
jgi:flagellar biosynthesis/type III secretory pathway chaperone